MINDMLKRLSEDKHAEITMQEVWQSNFRGTYEVEKALFDIKYAFAKDEGQGKLSIWSLNKDDRKALKDEAVLCWKRLEPLIVQYQKLGGPGIYEVMIRWNRIAYIVADDIETANRQASAIFSWLSSVKSPENPERSSLAVRLVYDNNPDLLSKKNKELADSVRSGISDAQKRIIAEQVRLRWLTAVSAVLPITGSGAI
jgi:hypothetical protein